MRTVLMALVVLWWCHFAIILPVILGQQAQDNLDRNQQGYLHVPGLKTFLPLTSESPSRSLDQPDEANGSLTNQNPSSKDSTSELWPNQKELLTTNLSQSTDLNRDFLTPGEIDYSDYIRFRRRHERGRGSRGRRHWRKFRRGRKFSKFASHLGNQNSLGVHSSLDTGDTIIIDNTTNSFEDTWRTESRPSTNDGENVLTLHRSVDSADVFHNSYYNNNNQSPSKFPEDLDDKDQSQASLLEDSDNTDQSQGSLLRDSEDTDQSKPLILEDSYDDDQSQPLLLDIEAPEVLGEKLTLVLEPVSDFLSPGFVIQRVQGNVSWLEEMSEDAVLCYFSGVVLQHPRGSNVAINLCGGVRGVIQLGEEKYYVEPVKLPNSTSTPTTTTTSSSSSSTQPSSSKASSFSSKSTSSSSSSSFSSAFSPSSPSSALRRKHVISNLSAKNSPAPSSCRITQNFKHQRLKNEFGEVVSSSDFVNKYVHKHYEPLHTSGANRKWRRGQGQNGGAEEGQGWSSRRKRSVGVSRKHTVETLVVADAKMAQYHGDDVQQYVLTLMSIVRSIYRDPSIRNFINVVVVKIIIYETSWETPFKVTQNAASLLKEFCIWQHRINDFTPNSERHHDTAILLTRENICRAPEKCDTLGLAEIGTICDKLRSCSIIEDNGISAAFTIAHELGHLFNLPHDDDEQCKGDFPDNVKPKNSFRVMSPTLDYKAIPWDWSNCSARIMTDALESGLGACLQDGLRVKKWLTTMKTYKEPGWIYSVNRQCELVFGNGYVICPFPVTDDPPCRRLWCEQDRIRGCRTKHMPWADGTVCGQNKICLRGRCVTKSLTKPKLINGGWGSWQQYGPCSRTCGGGVKKKFRECNNPIPANGGRYCLGSRVRYKSCNIKPCSIDSRDFREVQCDSDNMKRKYGFPLNSVWKPKYSGIHMKDACELYCRSENTSEYIQFSKKVVDGTKCAPLTDDVCVNGQCWHVGCDNRLGSTMKRDRCGVCGGDNFTCRTVTGAFNNAIYGYNHVTTIPSGATEIDIRQYGRRDGRDNDDGNYLALQNSQRDWILNGEFTVRTESYKIKVRGALMEYTGTDEVIERINTTMKIEERVNVYVLSVGDLNPPNITYSYMVSVSKNVQWKNEGWTKCSSICNGKRRSKIQCIREDDNLIVSKKRCRGFKRPSRITEKCNTDCKVSWRVFSKEDCPVRCGTGMRRQLVHCIKQTGYKNAEIVSDRECIKLYGVKPDEFVPCEGQCLPSYWMYTDWSSCSRTCGEGLQERQAKCVDEAGQELEDNECEMKDKMTTRQCNHGKCAEWTAGNWLGCSVTCGSGYKLRKVWCLRDGQKVDDGQCSKEKPEDKKECTLKECPQWYTGGWGPCSVTCGKGVSMRAVKCRVSDSFEDDSICDVSLRPNDRRSCYIGPCPTKTPETTTPAKTFPKAAYWRYGSWTECSASCGQGNKHRYVSCMDYQGNHVVDTECAHLSRPPKVETCMIKPCGDWRRGDWTDCSVTCGEGIQTRFVACTYNDQRQDDRFCDITIKPETEIRCNRGTCLTADDLSIAVITSNKVVGTRVWRVGSWSSCSSTCGSGWERRAVVCSDERGTSDKCDVSQKPDEFRACNSGDCPVWSIDEWGNCSSTVCGQDGYQRRQVVCRLSLDVLADSNCDMRTRPQDTQPCLGKCTSDERNTWQKGPWSACSVTCGRGIRSRAVSCVDSSGEKVNYDLCTDRKPRNTKRCSRGPCPKWHPGKWSKCSVTCGEGERTREVQCRDKRQRVVDSMMCSHHTKPTATMVCSRKDCSLYSWKIGPWSECSRTCGFGRKHRSVTCIDRNITRVSSHLCDNDRKPKIKRRCSEFPCPYVWNTSPWSECSASCGEGKQTRTVVCQAVTKEGWVLPGEVHYGCRPDERPSYARYCNYGDCSSRNHWTAGPWGKCSASCGNGRQRRQVICVDRNGQKTKRRFCVPLYRPVTSRECYSGHCYAGSCREFKQLTTIRKDGDYQLKVGNQLVKIYCKDMRSREPKEYISLPQGPEENFSETFDKRLNEPATCPFEGSRPEEPCDECRKQFYREAGNTTYSKVRIDLNRLTIVISDDAFSKTNHGKFIPYGTAGDCYSSNNCPQGRFSISLVDTGFIVSVNTTWNLNGNRASQRIWRLRDGQIIRGVCGGYCGVCSPNPKVGLKLELLR